VAGDVNCLFQSLALEDDGSQNTVLMKRAMGYTYSTASLIRTNWDLGMFGLVNFRINLVLQNTRAGIGDSRMLLSEGHNQGWVTM
jgi:hypothetical protein